MYYRIVSVVRSLRIASDLLRKSVRRTALYAKSKEELNVIKEEVETVNRKLHELTDEELAQVSGGNASITKPKDPLFQPQVNVFTPPSEE